MAGINKAIIVGNLGADPELRFTQSNTPVCKLSVATTRTWSNQQSGERQSETEWHRITVWGKQAEMCDKYLSKGRQVYIEGRLRTTSYDKDGQKHYSTEIVAEVVQFLGSKNDSEGGGGGGGGSRSNERPANHSSAPDPDDEVDF